MLALVARWWKPRLILSDGAASSQILCRLAPPPRRGYPRRPHPPPPRARSARPRHSPSSSQHHSQTCPWRAATGPAAALQARRGQRPRRGRRARRRLGRPRRQRRAWSGGGCQRRHGSIAGQRRAVDGAGRRMARHHPPLLARCARSRSPRATHIPALLPLLALGVRGVRVRLGGRLRLLDVRARVVNVLRARRASASRVRARGLLQAGECGGATGPTTSCQPPSRPTYRLGQVARLVEDGALSTGGGAGSSTGGSHARCWLRDADGSRRGGCWLDGVGHVALG